MSKAKLGNFEVVLGPDHLDVDIFYPDTPDSLRYVTLNLIDVRAADGIRVSYDKERDGWLIEQEVSYAHIDDGETLYHSCPEEPVWKEAAFIPAWQFEETIKNANSND